MSKFDYQNMLNAIRKHKITLRSKPDDFSEKDMSTWNGAIDLCYGIAERRREKFELKETTLIDDHGFPELPVTECCKIGPIVNENYCPNCGRKIVRK